MEKKDSREWARRLWRAEVRPLLLVALVIFSVRSSLADWNDVPSGSMEPTILIGDRVVVNKVAYDLKVPFTTVHLAAWSNPKRGDIVVFYSPHEEKRLVKRVVGLPGDTIELRDNALSVNGKQVRYDPLEWKDLPDVPASDALKYRYTTEFLPNIAREAGGAARSESAALPAEERPHVAAFMEGQDRSGLLKRNFGPYVVPPGAYFMMGDNRDVSFDSRYFGAVDRKRILGRVPTVALSLDHENFWAPRWNRLLKRLI